MAYYTIANFLHSKLNLILGDIYGKHQNSELTPEKMTNEVLDYIFLGTELPSNCTVSKDLLNVFKN